MILNVSGRTDIVAFYTEWFINRYREGFVDVRNPFYHTQISRIKFKDVDLILFCTKNPNPIIKYINEIKIPILFHITLTPYLKDIEPNVKNKKTIIEGIKKISKIIGKENIYIRYDPLFINEKYNLEYHIKAFDKMCKILQGYTKHIIISFIDDYKNVRKNKHALKYKKLTKEDLKTIGKNFYKSAFQNGMTVQTCAEEENLLEHGFIKSDCITKEIAYKKTGKTFCKKWKARNNEYCNCIEMVDIGEYNTCPHFCKYCYANYNETLVRQKTLKHDKNSTILVGHIEEKDIIKERKK